jgi:HAD superfamily hydrolase (TIGR01490 family)
MSLHIAVFDVDGTLLKGDCLRMAAVRSHSPSRFLWAALALLPWLLAWKLGWISTAALKEKTLALFRICERVNQAEASGNGQWLLPVLLQRLRPEALQRLHMHQQRGDRVVLCSASPRMLLAPLADALAVELIATELLQQNGRWLPRLVGPNCKGPEKVSRLTAHLGSLDDHTIEAYGDSQGDRELLQAAALPHYRTFVATPRPYPT